MRALKKILENNKQGLCFFTKNMGYGPYQLYCKIFVIFLLLKVTLIFVYDEFWIFIYVNKLLRFNFFNEFDI